MRYFALATDYDGTLAKDGDVDQPTLSALERVHKSGRKLILVTGRELDDLMSVFRKLDLFDLVVAENGALLYDPATHHETVLSEALPEEFVQALEHRGVRPISLGRVIVWVIRINLQHNNGRTDLAPGLDYWPCRLASCWRVLSVRP